MSPGKAEITLLREERQRILNQISQIEGTIRTTRFQSVHAHNNNLQNKEDLEKRVDELNALIGDKIKKPTVTTTTTNPITTISTTTTNTSVFTNPSNQQNYTSTPLKPIVEETLIESPKDIQDSFKETLDDETTPIKRKEEMNIRDEFDKETKRPDPTQNQFSPNDGAMSREAQMYEQIQRMENELRRTQEESWRMQEEFRKQKENLERRNAAAEEAHKQIVEKMLHEQSIKDHERNLEHVENWDMQPNITSTNKKQKKDLYELKTPISSANQTQQRTKYKNSPQTTNLSTTQGDPSLYQTGHENLFNTAQINNTNQYHHQINISQPKIQPPTNYNYGNVPQSNTQPQSNYAQQYQVYNPTQLNVIHEQQQFNNEQGRPNEKKFQPNAFKDEDTDHMTQYRSYEQNPKNELRNEKVPTFEHSNLEQKYRQNIRTHNEFENEKMQHFERSNYNQNRPYEQDIKPQFTNSRHFQQNYPHQYNTNSQNKFTNENLQYTEQPYPRQNQTYEQNINTKIETSQRSNYEHNHPYGQGIKFQNKFTNEKPYMEQNDGYNNPNEQPFAGQNDYYTNRHTQPNYNQNQILNDEQLYRLAQMITNNQQKSYVQPQINKQPYRDNLPRPEYVRRLRLIPIFNGKSYSDLRDFLQIVESLTKSYSNDAEMQELIQTIDLHLRGEAKEVIGNVFNLSFIEMKEQLLHHFSHLNNKEIINSQLENLRQNPSESITQYAERARDLMREKNAIFHNLSQEQKTEHNRIARKAFANGISNSRLRERLAIRGSNNLEDAIAYVIEAENDLITNIPNNELYCNYCKNPGHRQRDCRKAENSQGSLNNLIQAMKNFNAPRENTSNSNQRGQNWNSQNNSNQNNRNSSKNGNNNFNGERNNQSNQNQSQNWRNNQNNTYQTNHKNNHNNNNYNNGQNQNSGNRQSCIFNQQDSYSQNFAQGINDENLSGHTDSNLPENLPGNF